MQASIDIKRILVVVDPTVDRDPVLDKAHGLAAATGASLDLYINNSNALDERSFMYEGIDGSFFATQRKLWEAHHRSQLEELVAEFKEAQVAATFAVDEHHHLGEAIIKRVAATGPDLVLKSTHHHSLIERSVLTNTDWRLIRKCPVPLWLAKPQPWPADASIVTAVDPLHRKAAQVPLDHALLEAAKFLGGKLGRPVRVFHSWFPFTSAFFEPEADSSEHMQRIQAEHRTRLIALLAEHGLGEDSMHLARGNLVATLVAYLKEARASLLVIGALSRNVLERAIVGNTAESILESCPCDILVLKSR